ncbi:MAG: 50S ribosomal protein L9 [Verrucomicrobia bacterium 21-51-4]|nr:MAG: 50S ribosomal protein L9 [Verrucomicrobia bacterium 21-51-4]HQU09042.1 50S ribosomal protein L9 [Opitutales bacterium]
MAYSEILLLQPVHGLGSEGDQVKVRAGYARNFLLPNKVALPVNRANRKYVESLQAARARREAEEMDHAKALAGKLEAISIAIAVKTGDGGKMFGAVTAQHLAERLHEEGIELDRRKIQLHTPVKTLGKHTTKIKLHPELSVELSFEIVSENPIEENDSED